MMLKLICFTHKASPEHTEIVKKWIGATGIDGVQLYNIPNHKPEDLIRDNTVVVTFGKFAELAVAYCFTEKQRKNARHIFLPHPRQLIPQIANKEYRAQAQAVIEELKVLMAEEIFQPELIVITEKDLPDIKRNELIMLKKLIEETGKNSCLITSKNGKLIQLGNGPAKGKPDILLSFEELYGIRLIMDVLGVSEVEIAKHPDATDRVANPGAKETI